MIPLMKRQLPTWRDIEPYIIRAEASGQYTNFGVLHQELCAFLASRYSTGLDTIALTSSATVGLSLCIQYFKNKYPDDYIFRVLMPSWTFSATAHSARFIGCNISLMDIGLDGCLCPQEIINQVKSNKIEKPDLILPVIPFGAKYSPQPWEQLSTELDIPVVIDCAAGFSSAKKSVIPTVVSMHATK